MMKRFTSLLLLAAFTAIASAHAQMGGPSGSGGGNATDDAVSSISQIRRPTTPTPAPANQSGPKKPFEATLATDAKGKSPATVFAATTPKIYLLWKDDSAIKGEKLRAVWVGEDVVGMSSKNKKLTEGTETMPGPGANGDFYLPASSKGFPAGKYRVDLYEGTKLAKSLKFTVTK
jgi:hypothetical protein